MSVFQIQGSTSTEEKIVRPIANFPPSVWGDHFIAYPCSLPSTLEDFETPRIRELKEEVKAMFKINDVDLGKTLRLIDDLQHLGLEYHFEEEIDESLRRILQDDHFENSGDICIVALRFRLLRQQGHNVSSGVFEKFKDGEGKFKQELSSDAEGLLQLYEASWLATHDDKILDVVQAFARLHMNQLLASAQYNTSDEADHSNDNVFLAKKMERALKMPFHRGMRRVEVRHYIENVYKYSSNHGILLELAKLDYNHLQSLHQAEIKEISIWWKELGISQKLSFARNRTIEMYFWVMGVNFEPQYSQCRMIFTKLMATMPSMDDMFDAYGTLPELQLLNDVIQRWDLEDVDKLPDYMKVFLTFFKSVIKEIEDELTRQGRLHYMHYFIESLKAWVGGYFQEAKWVNADYIPDLEEYLQNGLYTSTHPMLVCGTVVLMGGEAITKDALEWIVAVPKIVVASSVYTRLVDDLGCTKTEQERKHVASSVQCYMKQHSMTEEDARVELRKITADAWKDQNKECLNQSPFSKKFIDKTTVGLTRIACEVYKNEDSGLSLDPKGNTKEVIASLLVHPIQD